MRRGTSPEVAPARSSPWHLRANLLLAIFVGELYGGTAFHQNAMLPARRICAPPSEAMLERFSTAPRPFSHNSSAGRKCAAQYCEQPAACGLPLSSSSSRRSWALRRWPRLRHPCSWWTIRNTQIIREWRCGLQGRVDLGADGTCLSLQCVRPTIVGPCKTIRLIALFVRVAACKWSRRCLLRLDGKVSCPPFPPPPCRLQHPGQQRYYRRQVPEKPDDRSGQLQRVVSGSQPICQPASKFSPQAKSASAAAPERGIPERFAFERAGRDPKRSMYCRMRTHKHGLHCNPRPAGPTASATRCARAPSRTPPRRAPTRSATCWPPTATGVIGIGI